MMLPTYRAILKGTQILWLDAPPPLPEDAEVHITVLHPETAPKSEDQSLNQEEHHGSDMAAALEKLAEINSFADVDPVEWQREIRQDPSLPGHQD